MTASSSESCDNALEVDPTSPRRARIAVEGTIDLESTARLDGEFDLAVQAGAPHVTLDLSCLVLADAAAIASILHGMEKLRAVGTSLEVLYPSPMALQLFEACNRHQMAGIEFLR